MTLPNQHTRKLNRRQIAAIGLEPNPYKSAWTEKPLGKKRRLRRVIRKERPTEIKETLVLSQRERVELSERRDKTAAWIKTVSREQWQKWMEEDLQKFHEDAARKEREQEDIDWYTRTLDQARKDFGITGDYYYSKDHKTVYLNVRCIPAQEEKVYIAIDADDLERVAVRGWTRRIANGARRIVCYGDIPQISIGRYIANTGPRQFIRHLNGDRLDYRKSNLNPVFPAPPPNEWGNYIPARQRSERPLVEKSERKPQQEIIRTNGAQFYGPKWWEIQPQAMARSGGFCERCKKKKAVHVHHILPIRYFVYSDDAHYLGNTLAVCRACHAEEHRQLKRKFPLFNHLQYKTF